MSHELIDIWLAHGDGGERGTGPVIAHCSSESLANSAAKGRGWYGGNGQVKQAKALRINGEVWLLAREKPIDLDSEQAKRDAELRDKTLSTLSADQLRVLGLATGAQHDQ